MSRALCSPCWLALLALFACLSVKVSVAEDAAHPPAPPETVGEACTVDTPEGLPPYAEAMLNRLLTYAKIDTASAHGTPEKVPSTPGQWVLLNMARLPHLA